MNARPKQNDFKTAEEIIAQGAAEEWRRLKDLTRTVTAGKAVDGNPFRWEPYHAYDQDFLQLTNVAPSFSDRGKQTGIARTCGIRFDRHASSA
jgi:hypothetical protein